MNELYPERLEPASRMVESQRQRPWPEIKVDRRQRKQSAPQDTDHYEKDDKVEAPQHKLDSLA